MKTTFLLLSVLAFTAFSSSNLEHQILSGQVPFTRESAFKVYQSYIPHGVQNQEFQTFYENFGIIHKHQQNPDRTFEMGINRFAFVSFEEFSGKFLGVQNCSATQSKDSKKRDLKSVSVPLSVDWRDNGIITPVKDQRRCGSCWTFSASGALEAHWALKTGVSPISLSEQHLVDCAGAFQNYGCSGGLPSQAFEYIRSNGGISAENTYPYQAVNGTACMFNPQDVSALVPGGSVNITFQDEEELHQTVGSIGPVSVAFQVMSDFQFYTGGVYSNVNCSTSPADVNHAVLAVGYGSDLGEDYWILKNSWNANWGENGYFRMKRGVNMCGVADCAAYPDVNGTSIESQIELEIQNIENQLQSN